MQFEKDALGRVLRELQGGHVVETEYDQFGQRLALRSSLGAAVATTRGLAGNVEQLQAGSWHARFTQDAFGQEVERQLGAVHLRWQYDALGRPVQQQLRTGHSSPRRERRYRWQTSERLSEIEDSLTGLTQFAYDAWGNLAATRHADSPPELRHPDAVGNLFRTAARTDRRYGAGGQLREADGTRYRYDAEGNLVRKTQPDGATWHYA